MDPTPQPDIAATPPQRPTGVYPTPDGGREVVIGPEHVGASREAIVEALQASAPDLSIVIEGDGIRIGWAKARGAAPPSTRKMKGGKARRPGRRLANATPAPRPVRR